MIALLDSTGGRRETVAYSAYGVPFGRPAADANGDGTVNVSDFFVISGAFGESLGDPNYSIRADINLDGTVDSSDSTIHSGQSGYALGRGNLSRNPGLTGGIGSRLGYAGYAWEPSASRYHVRHRVLDPLRGRWSKRDPLGYVDSPTMYAYVNNQAVSAVDPRGLARFAFQPEPQPDGSVESDNPVCLKVSGIDGVDDDGSAPAGSKCTGGSGNGYDLCGSAHCTVRCKNSSGVRYTTFKFFVPGFCGSQFEADNCCRGAKAVACGCYPPGSSYADYLNCYLQGLGAFTACILLV